jgi:hypothetical protein
MIRALCWDQGTVPVELGLIDPTGLPLTGAAAAAKLRDRSLPDPFLKKAEARQAAGRARGRARAAARQIGAGGTAGQAG